MKKILFSLSLLGLAATSAKAEITAPVVVQFGPTTPYSTINCANFTKLPDGSWKALNPERFGLGFVQGIIPPVLPIKTGGFIYNNIDLYSQLEAQCAVSAVVRARY